MSQVVLPFLRMTIDRLMTAARRADDGRFLMKNNGRADV
jgi:hypothetical protein